MLKKNLLFIFSILSGFIIAFSVTGCSDDDPVNTGNNTPNVLAAGTRGQDRTLSADSTYTLTGFYLVDPGTTLTIPAGTVIKGSPGSAIIATRGNGTLPSGQIIAEGTSDNPVVFTSDRPEGSRDRGNWGGIVMSGLSDLNVPGGFGVGEGGVGEYGYGGILSSPKMDDNSGRLRYCRIEYGGTRIAADNEINGLTLNAVGNGTTIEYVQTHMIADDGFEWFGGTVNAKYLVSSGNDDDAFDMDLGFNGDCQYLFVMQADDKADRGFEVNNDGDGSDNEPYTSARVANVTIIGGDDTKNDGFYLRGNNRLKIWNAVVTNVRYAVAVDADNTNQNAVKGDLFVKNSLLNGSTNSYITRTKVDGKNTFIDAIYQAVADSDWHNTIGDPQLRSTNFEDPDPRPQNGAAKGIGTPPSGLEPANYAGAFDPDASSLWIAGWTNFKKN